MSRRRDARSRAPLRVVINGWQFSRCFERFGSECVIRQGGETTRSPGGKLGAGAGGLHPAAR